MKCPMTLMSVMLVVCGVPCRAKEKEAPVTLVKAREVIEATTFPLLKEDLAWKAIGRVRIVVFAGSTITNHGPKVWFVPVGMNREQLLEALENRDTFVKANPWEDVGPTTDYQMHHGDVLVLKKDMIMDIEAMRGGLIELTAAKGGYPLVSLGKE